MAPSITPHTPYAATPSIKGEEKRLCKSTSPLFKGAQSSKKLNQEGRVAKIEKNLGNKGIQGTFTELKGSPELSPEFVEVRRSFAGAKSGRLELHKLH
ncbi:unnamed protein product [Cuscuta europaea]|uniref:Uncharacterized protein n=1 Tax=Cuscuta europaea TaxID=41803 RepID=A0A9P0Z4X0_CUSEU|nr:unnamed protein product [Cuscuta europaea]